MEAAFALSAAQVPVGEGAVVNDAGRAPERDAAPNSRLRPRGENGFVPCISPGKPGVPAPPAGAAAQNQPSDMIAGSNRTEQDDEASESTMSGVVPGAPM